MNGWAPVAAEEEQAIVEERRCDEIAADWVRFIGGIEEFRARWPELVELFGGEITCRVGRIDLCGVVDTWEEEYGLTGDDFIRLRKQIESWIVSHSSLRGRLRIGLSG